MARICCLAGIKDENVTMLREVLHNAGESLQPILATLNVGELGKLAPQLLLCDIDGLERDPLELVRQLRFVLPDCVIAVYGASIQRTWAFACHLAGANCMLCKSSTKAQLSSGIRYVLQSGCFTDTHFVAT